MRIKRYRTFLYHLYRGDFLLPSGQTFSASRRMAQKSLYPPADNAIRSDATGSIQKKRLFKKGKLQRAGLSDYFIFPRYRENFERVFMNDLAHFNIDQYFGESILHEHRILNASR